jgi:hypothetical protein
MLLYPKSIHIITNTVLAQAGTLEVIPPEAPLTLFVWGPARVLPVRVTGFSITEEAFDTLLNPIRAKVDLTLNVLSTADLKVTNPGYTIFMAHQIAKEVVAMTNLFTSVANRRRRGEAVVPRSKGEPTMFRRRCAYYRIRDSSLRRPDGTVALTIRFRLPRGDSVDVWLSHVVAQGDRSITRYPARYPGCWATTGPQLCDANTAMRPDELTERLGRRLKIPLPLSR